MFSRCSHCNTWQSVTVAQLRLGRGLLVCSNCAEYFDALATLSEETEVEVKRTDNALNVFYPLGSVKNLGVAWLVALMLSISILILQIWYFENAKLLKQPKLHSVLSALCDRLNCKLPLYKNPESCMVLQSDLRNNPDDSFMLSAVIMNRSPWPQSYPDINLILLDLNGEAVAQRIFSPHEYAKANEFDEDEVEEISIHIVPPGGVKIGGYNLALQ